MRHQLQLTESQRRPAQGSQTGREGGREGEREGEDGGPGEEASLSARAPVLSAPRGDY